MARSLLVALWVVSVTPSAAQERHDPLTELGDPLEIERHLRRIGDGPVLAKLSESPLLVRLGAIRATRFLEAPERALGPLATIAAGDDPELAPSAARAGQRIAEALTLDALESREADVAAVRAGAESWRAVARDETARPDIRALATRAAAALDALPAP